MNKDVALVLGIATAAVVGVAVISKIEEKIVKTELAKARDSLFDVSAGCETITWKGGVAVPDSRSLELAGTYYVRPWLKEELGAGASDGYAPGSLVEATADLSGISALDMLTAQLLYDLFPECKEKDPGPWPPDSLFSTFGVIWVAMKLYMDDQIRLVMTELGA